MHGNMLHLRMNTPMFIVKGIESIGLSTVLFLFPMTYEIEERTNYQSNICSFRTTCRRKKCVCRNEMRIVVGASIIVSHEALHAACSINVTTFFPLLVKGLRISNYYYYYYYYYYS